MMRELKPIDAMLIRPRDAAAMLNLSERTLWTMTKVGTIPSMRIGRSVRYSVDSLRAWIAKSQNSAA